MIDAKKHLFIDNTNLLQDVSDAEGLWIFWVLEINILENNRLSLIVPFLQRHEAKFMVILDKHNLIEPILLL